MSTNDPLHPRWGGQALDTIQAERIEKVHEGWLYQHLYAAGCLLLAARAQTLAVRVERDEDIDVFGPSTVAYVQVKKRGTSLRPSDVKAALQRFAGLRNEHHAGRREGTPAFFIACNTGPSVKLAKDANSWPSDTTLITPGNAGPLGLPPAASSPAELFSWCVQRARELPYLAIEPATLVLKLAGVVQAACAGQAPNENHSIETAGLSRLFEQVPLSLQRFPDAPALYIPHPNEPPFISVVRSRLIVGGSGSGKSAWASQLAVLCAGHAIYFDVGLGGANALAHGLVREIAAVAFAGDPEALRHVLRPDMSSLEALRFAAQRLQDQRQTVTLVLDNAHRAAAADLLGAINAASSDSFRYVLLAWPWPEQSAVAARLGIRAEHLEGWDAAAIATESFAHGQAIGLAVAARIRALTGGLPLFVTDLRTSATSRGITVETACLELESRSHTEVSAQEAILQRVVADLAPPGQTVVGLLARVEVPLERAELIAVLGAALEMRPADTAAVLRELMSRGIVERRGGEHITLHDAYRLIAFGLVVDHEIVRRAEGQLERVLLSHLQGEYHPAELVAFLRLLRRTDRLTDFVDQVSRHAEGLRDMGMLLVLLPDLEAIAASANASTYERFWAFDSLAFAREGEARRAAIEGMVTTMEKGGEELGDEERLRTAEKMAMVLAAQGDCDGSDEALRVAISFAKTEEQRLSLRYNACAARFEAGDFEYAAATARELASALIEFLGAQVRENGILMPPGEGSRRVHLADCFDLEACALRKLKRDPRGPRGIAFQLYEAAGAHSSMVRAGLELATEMMEIGGSPSVPAALGLLGLLLKCLREHHLLDQELPVSALRAVALAHLGCAEEARAELRRLRPFLQESADDARIEFERQCALVERLAKDGTAP